ncbi:hypothetical protein K461DRAFT_277871 [Myriangium duriaei CBS 260.36]|uniref:Protein Asterix n=1 Tax=Myriangium duriaei CBS 260.36 TaxID=1168546 RepID=A0A9P4MHE1_9PEZI|nr:hypothetical protein K461DRAFT_277871 [Myriangium duriaei CBS 260.36]
MSKRDMRRSDLVVPYLEPAVAKSDMDFASTLGSTLPMAAIFLRSKMIGWVAVTFAIQTWLAESPDKKASTSGIYQVGMAFMSLGVSYMSLFLPPTPSAVPTGAGAASPAPA